MSKKEIQSDLSTGMLIQLLEQRRSKLYFWAINAHTLMQIATKNPDEVNIKGMFKMMREQLGTFDEAIK